MLLGYNTNGFAHHRLEDALTILARLGYQSVAITLDYHSLNPFDPDLPDQIRRVRGLLNSLRLRSVIETGARFLLDPWHKHQPTLVSVDAQGREKRLDFLRRAIDIAWQLSADAVGFWSGTPQDKAADSVYMDRLVQGCLRLCDYAAERNVRLAFEPEPGMFIDTMARFAELKEKINHPFFGLTMDIGHLHCLGETPITNHLRRWRELIWNVHIEDMRQGVHEHLMFYDGEIYFPDVFKALWQIHYSGGIHAELSRHSHVAVAAAQQAMVYLSSFMK